MVQPIELNLAPFTPKGVRELNQVQLRRAACTMPPARLGRGWGKGQASHTRAARAFWLYNNL